MTPLSTFHLAAFVQKQTVINHHHFTRCNTTEMQLHRDVQLLCRAGSLSSNSLHHAYWIKKTISQTSYETVQLGIVVRRRCNGSLNYVHSKKEDIAAGWTTTDEIVAIKVSSIVQNSGEFMFVDGPLKGKLKEVGLLLCTYKYSNSRRQSRH
jgi:hypothetical protein